MLRDPAKTLRFAFGEAGPRAITAVSVWSLAAAGAGGGFPPSAVPRSLISIGSAGYRSVFTCYARPPAPDPARSGWNTSQLLCGGTGDTAWLHFPGAAGPLAVRMCTVDAADPAGGAGAIPPDATLSIPSV